MVMYRQGDVLILSAKTIPKTAKKQDRCILALGEATGHAHQIKEEAFLWVDTDGSKYVEVFGSEATVQHEEHGPIVLAGPAIYRVVQQREYTPEEIRNVAD
jgi:hypothetical protein